jgi:hypothetical protein
MVKRKETHEIDPEVNETSQNDIKITPPPTCIEKEKE